MPLEQENLSSDLIWQVCRSNNAYLVKRKTNGGVQFSRDPFNLVNKHSRKHEGFVNEKAISIVPDSNTISLTTKLPSRVNKPAKSNQHSSFAASTPTRKLYKSVVNTTAKNGYRPDLRAESVARASAIRQSQKDKKDVPAGKLRGAKARKAREAEL